MIFRILLCLGMGAFSLYSYLEMQNGLTGLKLRVPELAAQVRRLQEENASLSYEIVSLENPLELLEIARHSEYAHLKYPASNEVITLKEGQPLMAPQEDTSHEKPTTRLATIRGGKS